MGRVRMLKVDKHLSSAPYDRYNGTLIPIWGSCTAFSRNFRTSHSCFVPLNTTVIVPTLSPSDNWSCQGPLLMKLFGKGLAEYSNWAASLTKWAGQLPILEAAEVWKHSPDTGNASQKLKHDYQSYCVSCFCLWLLAVLRRVLTHPLLWCWEIQKQP